MAAVIRVVTHWWHEGRALDAAIVSQNLRTSATAMRVCLVYDCLFPHTVGGAERWYRNLAERLADEGHNVVYITLRQWSRGEDPAVHGTRVVVVGPRMALYAGSGRRRISPPLVFGAGVLWHLLRHGRRYDAVHTASFPYFSLLAAALARPVGRYRLFVDWHEAWTLGYWREYLGPLGGRIGWEVQRLCLRIPQRAFCFSRLHAQRLRDEGYAGQVTLLEGEYVGPLERHRPREPELVAVFAGRFIPEKRPEALVPALVRARESLPQLRAVLYGDGPERARVERQLIAAGLNGMVRLPGFVNSEEVEFALARALCMVLPSRREGYGLVVVEAASHGTPSVVVADPDNAAVELVEEGVNGFVARSAAADDLAAAIMRVYEGGEALRRSTAEWFATNAKRLSLGSSLEIVARAYAAA
jgi:glycosyltransferase involved in cell wall biosynthesis